MDCAAEEVLVRAKLEGMPDVRSVDFDLAKRTVTVHHEGNADGIGRAIDSLRLGSTLLRSEAAQDEGSGRPRQARTLWTVLSINAGFFLLEAAMGLLARSLGLLADSLDMLADAIVYSLSLAAVGRAGAAKRRVARWSGYGQLALAGLGMFEVIRRIAGVRVLPNELVMILVAALALVANAVTLSLLARVGSGEAHIRASVIFTSNDVIINLGVIVAGVLVGVTGSGVPDVVVGTIVFGVVARGALRILALAR